MADGAGKLAEGGTKLTSGLEGLQTGVVSLGQGLSNASDQLKSASTESKNAEILSNPLNLSKTDNDQVPVNGIAMAPYMISVAPLCCSNINEYDLCEVAFRTSSRESLGLVEISS